ncbi:MAG TPA: DUF4390 domain-containing protein [Steroidobacteraceae bacterium]|nr:DUF4390 domain-containing protein [Steroidobacteraceae bacterium]
MTVHCMRFLRSILRPRIWPLLLLAGSPLLVQERAWAEAAPVLGVRTAYVQLVEGVYLLNARLQLPLSSRVRAALSDGVPLTLVLELEVSRARHYWLDESVASLRQEYQLQYQAVSDRYVVRNSNSGEQASYPDLDSALEQMARVSSVPVLDESLIRKGYRHEFSLRATLNLGDMPDTLRILMFWTNDYHRVSEWYTWPLLQ